MGRPGGKMRPARPLLWARPRPALRARPAAALRRSRAALLGLDPAAERNQPGAETGISAMAKGGTAGGGGVKKMGIGI